LYPPTASAPDSGAGLTRRPRDPLSHACLPPAASFPPSRSASRRPIWAGARGDNSLVGPGTPRVSKHRQYHFDRCLLFVVHVIRRVTHIHMGISMSMGVSPYPLMYMDDPTKFFLVVCMDML
jgi:hypothetical protein